MSKWLAALGKAEFCSGGYAWWIYVISKARKFEALKLIVIVARLPCGNFNLMAIACVEIGWPCHVTYSHIVCLQVVIVVIFCFIARLSFMQMIKYPIKVSRKLSHCLLMTEPNGYLTDIFALVACSIGLFCKINMQMFRCL